MHRGYYKCTTNPYERFKTYRPNRTFKEGTTLLQAYNSTTKAACTTNSDERFKTYRPNIQKWYDH